jgi:putative membrane protein
MSLLISFLITTLITAISLLIISKIEPLGIEIDDFGKAVIAGIVFGILNAFVKPVLFWLTIPLTVLSLGVFLIVLNVIIFSLAAWLVQGFRLRFGFWSALLGTFALSIINSVLNFILEKIFPNLP